MTDGATLHAISTFFCMFGKCLSTTEIATNDERQYLFIIVQSSNIQIAKTVQVPSFLS